VNDHGIPGLQREVLLCQSLLQILHRNLIGFRQYIHTLQRGHVDQHTPRHQRADILDAELRESVTA